MAEIASTHFEKQSWFVFEPLKSDPKTLFESPKSYYDHPTVRFTLQLVINSIECSKYAHHFQVSLQ